MRRAVLLTFILCVGLSARAVYGAYIAPTPFVRSQSHNQTAYILPTTVSPGIRAYLNQETNPALFRVLYQYGEAQGAADGAVGPNVGSSPQSWFLEYQRAGGTDIIAGVLRHDTPLIERGLKIFQFGLDRESRSGSFPGSAWPFHGTAMFLAEAAPSLIVLRFSGYGTRFTPQIRTQSSRMREATYAMVRSVGGAPRIDDPTKNHRWFEAALALQGVGALTADSRLQGWASRYARRGIKMQRSDGVMPENGGHDTGYQALGLTYALRFFALSAGTSISHNLYPSLQRAEMWELSHVKRDGTIDQSGDTRTAGCRERDPAGRCKTAFYAPIFNALTRWSIVAHAPRFERAALNVWLVNWTLQPGDNLPPAGLQPEPNPVRVGTWITVSGARFRPLEVVRVYFDDRLMQRIACDQTGTFGGHSSEPNAHFAVPPVGSGTHVVSARGSLGTNRYARITVTS